MSTSDPRDYVPEGDLADQAAAIAPDDEISFDEIDPSKADVADQIDQAFEAPGFIDDDE